MAKIVMFTVFIVLNTLLPVTLAGTVAVQHRDTTLDDLKSIDSYVSGALPVLQDGFFIGTSRGPVLVKSAPPPGENTRPTVRSKYYNTLPRLIPAGFEGIAVSHFNLGAADPYQPISSSKGLLRIPAAAQSQQYIGTQASPPSEQYVAQPIGDQTQQVYQQQYVAAAQQPQEYIAQPQQQYIQNDPNPQQQFIQNEQLPQQQFIQNEQLPQQQFIQNDQPPQQQFVQNDQPPQPQFIQNDQPPQQQFVQNDQPPQSQFTQNDPNIQQQFIQNEQQLQNEQTRQFFQQQEQPQQQYLQAEQPQQQQFVQAEQRQFPQPQPEQSQQQHQFYHLPQNHHHQYIYRPSQLLSEQSADSQQAAQEHAQISARSQASIPPAEPSFQNDNLLRPEQDQPSVTAFQTQVFGPERFQSQKLLRNEAVVATTEFEETLPETLRNRFYKNANLATILAQESLPIQGEQIISEWDTNKIAKGKIHALLRGAGLI